MRSLNELEELLLEPVLGCALALGFCPALALLCLALACLLLLQVLVDGITQSWGQAVAAVVVVAVGSAAVAPAAAAAVLAPAGVPVMPVAGAAVVVAAVVVVLSRTALAAVAAMAGSSGSSTRRRRRRRGWRRCGRVPPVAAASCAHVVVALLQTVKYGLRAASLLLKQPLSCGPWARRRGWDRGRKLDSCRGRPQDNPFGSAAVATSLMRLFLDGLLLLLLLFGPCVSCAEPSKAC